MSIKDANQECVNRIQEGTTVWVDLRLGTGCGACRRACPADAIRGIRKKPHRFDQELCIKCGTYSDACKFNAIMRAKK